MNENNSDIIEQLNQQIDLMLSSEDALNAALEGDNPLLHVAARLANDSPPILSDVAKANIQAQVVAAKIVAPNYLGWVGGLVVLAAIIIVAGFSVLSNNPDQDNSTIALTQSSIESDSSDENLVEIVPTEESSELSVEATEEAEATETEEETPEVTVESDISESQSTEDTTAGSSEASGIMFVNPGGPVNLRSGPGTSFTIIDTAQPNTEVTVITVSGEWVEVTTEDGLQGWIASFLLSSAKGSDGQTTSPGGDGRDTEDCDKGNSCNARGQTGENQGNGNGRGQGNN